jgi:hypothetical protein
VQAIAVELDVLPAQPIDLLAPQARVEGECIRDTVVELQCGEQLLGLLERRDTSSRLLVVRRQLDAAGSDREKVNLGCRRKTGS